MAVFLLVIQDLRLPFLTLDGLSWVLLCLQDLKVEYQSYARENRQAALPGTAFASRVE